MRLDLGVIARLSTIAPDARRYALTAAARAFTTLGGAHLSIGFSAEQNNTIRDALRALGVAHGRVLVEQHYGRAVVYLDGERFRIWDFMRGCFVD